MEQIVTCLLMVIKFTNLKQKILRLWQFLYVQGNVSKDWSVDNMKKIGLNDYVYDFSVDYDTIAGDDILDIHKYSMKKKWHSVIKMFEFVKKCFFTGLTFLSTLTSVNSLSCISMNNQECKVRPQIININSDELVLSF